MFIVGRIIVIDDWIGRIYLPGQIGFNLLDSSRQDSTATAKTDGIIPTTGREKGGGMIRHVAFETRIAWESTGTEIIMPGHRIVRIVFAFGAADATDGHHVVAGETGQMSRNAVLFDQAVIFQKKEVWRPSKSGPDVSGQIGTGILVESDIGINIRF